MIFLRIFIEFSWIFPEISVPVELYTVFPEPQNPGQKPGQKSGQKSGQNLGQKSGGPFNNRRCGLNGRNPMRICMWKGL